MTEHHLKTWPPQFQAILDRTKTSEFRRADRPFAVGDLLYLEEYVPAEVERDGEVWVEKEPAHYTGRRTIVKVTHIMDKGFGLPDGFVIMSLDFLRPVPTYVGNTGHGIPAQIPTHTFP
jgi:Domain of unknown function (DUF3850)